MGFLQAVSCQCLLDSTCQACAKSETPRWGPPNQGVMRPGLVRFQVEDFERRQYEHTQRLQCSSFLVMTYLLLRDSNILPKKALGYAYPDIDFTAC